MLWRNTFDTPSYQRLFDSPEEKNFGYTLPGTEQSAVDLVLSLSFVAILPDDKKVEIGEEVRKIIRAAEKTWLDESKGVFEYPLKVCVVICQKK